MKEMSCPDERLVTTMRFATWNTEWITRQHRAFDQAKARIQELEADVLVLTEVTSDLLPKDGHLLLGGEDWGYKTSANRRKVVLWSRWPIEDRLTDALDPPGRHVAATIASPEGEMRVHAICIPWRDAHLRTGRKDRAPWEEHLLFLNSLSELLASEREAPGTRDRPLVVMGDVNQRGGRYPYRSAETKQAWESLLERESLMVCTPDEIVDKVALSPGFSVEDLSTFPPDGISDHHAVSAEATLS